MSAPKGTLGLQAGEDVRRVAGATRLRDWVRAIVERTGSGKAKVA